MAVININITGSDRLEELNRLLQTAKDNAGQLERSLNSALDPGQASNLQGQLEKLTQEISKLTPEVSKLETELSKSSKALDQLKKYNKDLDQLKKRYATLNQEIEKSKRFGFSTSATRQLQQEANKVKAEIESITKSYKRLNEEVKRGSGPTMGGGGVGGQKRFGWSIGGIGANVLGAVAVMKAYQGITTTLQEGAKTVLDYEHANAALAAILGTTTEQTKSLQDQQRQLGETTAFTATEVTNLQIELSKLGFTQKEVLDASAAVVNFAVATESDVPRAAALAGAALRSFQLDAKEMERVVSTMAVATTKSALDFSKLEVAMPIVAGVAHEFGATVEDVSAQLGVLSNRGMQASTAATALRNIYLRSAKAGLTFDDALDKLANSQTAVNDALALFGVRGALQATILAHSRDETAALKEEITDVNKELKEMADQRLESVRGQWRLFTSALQEFSIIIDGVIGFTDALSSSLKTLTSRTRLISGVIKGDFSFMEAVKLVSLPGDVAAGYLNAISDAQVEINKIVREQTERGIAQGYDPEVAKTLAEAMAHDIRAGLQTGWDEIIDPEIAKREQTIAELNKRIREIGEEIERKKKKEKIYREASIGWLEKQIALQKELIKETTDESRYEKLATDLQKLIIRLDEAKKKVKEFQDQVQREHDTRMAMAREKELGPAQLIDFVSPLPDALAPSSKVQAKMDKESEKRFNETIKQYLKWIKAWDKGRRKAISDEERYQQRVQRELGVAASRAAQAANDAIFQIMDNRLQRQTSMELDAIDKVYKARIDAAKGSSAAQAQLQEELEREREKIEKAAFEKSKRRQIAEAIISGAAAALQSLAKTTLLFPASLIGPAAIAAQVAAQIAVIRSQSYEKGGFTGNKGMPDPDVPGRKIVGYVHDKEYVVTKEGVEKFPEMIAEIERHRLRGFAEGGFTSPQINYQIMAANASPQVQLSIEEMYQAIYRGAKQGSQDGSFSGIKEGERGRELRTLREARVQQTSRQ